jgi:hypothetical protein
MDANQYSTKVDLLLTQYIKYYPLYTSGRSTEYDGVFHNIEANLSSTYKDMFLLENKLTKEIQALRAAVSTSNVGIKESKEELAALQSEYAAIQNVAGASGPMLKQKNEIKQKKEEQLNYFMSAAVVVLYLLGRNFFTD